MDKAKQGGHGFSTKKQTGQQRNERIRDNIRALDSQALKLASQGQLEEAAMTYRRLLKLQPTNDNYHGNLGAILKMQGKLREAFHHIKKALDINPNNHHAHNNAGIIHKDFGRVETSIASHKKAIELKPEFPEAYLNLGNSLQENGELSDAVAAFGKAIELKPGYLEAQWNLSQAMLITGNYARGWELYECRAHKVNEPIHPFAIPACSRWEGDMARNDKQLLIISEQGLGDTLHFMRYAIALRNRGFQITLCAQPKLHSLIQASDIDPSPLSPQAAKHVSDGNWIALLSVPRHLNVTPDNPIINEPYIKTTDELDIKWKNILHTERRPIIGINWQGDPSHEKRNSIGRSLRLESFALLTKNTSLSLLSLQKGFGHEQMATCSFKDYFVSAQSLVNDTWDFLETAAIIANCDLVITSDTSVAHLAGGMGKTTWLLLKKVPEWRWGLEGDTTFWYPSMRLFRQNERGNWDEVMKRVLVALQAKFGCTPTSSKPC